MAVRDQNEFLDRASELLGIDRAEISMETPVPDGKLEEVIDIVAFHGCSDWRDHLPADRAPTLLEAAQCIRGPFGGD